MNRTLLAMLVMVVAGAAMADDASKKAPGRPIGTWTRTVEDGSWTIAVEEGRILFTAKGPGDRIMVLTSPKYEISDEGILFGYVREVTMSAGSDTSNLKVVHPFAFRLKVTGETLAVSDLSMRSVDARAHFVMTGDYKKEPDRNAAKSVSPASELKR
jgi:hypothetical protein